MNSCLLFAIGQIGQSLNGAGKRDTIRFTCKFSIHEHPYKDGSWCIPNSLLLRKIELLGAMIDRFKSHGLLEGNVVMKVDCDHSPSPIRRSGPYAPVSQEAGALCTKSDANYAPFFERKPLVRRRKLLSALCWGSENTHE